MSIRLSGKNWMLFTGRDFRPFVIFIGIGLRPNAEQGEIRWRHWGEWAPRAPIKLVWRDRKLVGFCALGRCRVFR